MSNRDLCKIIQEQVGHLPIEQTVTVDIPPELTWLYVSVNGGPVVPMLDENGRHMRGDEYGPLKQPDGTWK